MAPAAPAAPTRQPLRPKRSPSGVTTTASGWARAASTAAAHVPSTTTAEPTNASSRPSTPGRAPRTWRRRGSPTGGAVRLGPPAARARTAPERASRCRVSSDRRAASTPSTTTAARASPAAASKAASHPGVHLDQVEERPQHPVHVGHQTRPHHVAEGHLGDGDHPGGLVAARFHLFIGEQHQVVERTNHGAAVEHGRPGDAIEEMGQRRAEKAADVDQHVERSPADGGVLIAQCPRQGALDARLENGHADGEDDAAEQERPEGPLRGHDEITEDVDGYGGRDGFLVAVAVGEPAGKNRHQRFYQRPDSEDNPLVDLGEMKAAGAVGLGDIDGDDHPDAVVGQSFEHLDAVDHPECAGEVR